MSSTRISQCLAVIPWYLVSSSGFLLFSLLSNYIYFTSENVLGSVFQSFRWQFLKSSRWRRRRRNRREAGFSILMDTQCVCWGCIHKSLPSHLGPVIRASYVNRGPGSGVVKCRFSGLVIQGIHLHAMYQLIDMNNSNTLITGRFLPQCIKT